MQKIILFYKFVPIEDPQTMSLWQKVLAGSCNLKGRILISRHGINATLGGEVKELKHYLSQTRLHPSFKGLTPKWSDGKSSNFPKLSVKVRPEIVTFGAADQIEVDSDGIIGGGKHLKPEAVHELVRSRGNDVVFFDGRNGYEAKIGRFKNAHTPDVAHTRDFIAEIKQPKYAAIKNKPVVTYCTGGIRCEVLSMLMKKEGFKEVYQLDGGIQKYGEKYGDDGLWEGSLYVFDGRLSYKFSDKAVDIASCVFCDKPTSDYLNCDVKVCNKRYLVCGDCRSRSLCPECASSNSATQGEVDKVAHSSPATAKTY